MSGMSRAKRLETAINQIRDGLQALEDLQSEYTEWKDNLPENLRDSPVGEKLAETVDVFDSAVNEIECAASDLENVDLPLGFGRD